MAETVVQRSLETASLDYPLDGQALPLRQHRVVMAIRRALPCIRLRVLAFGEIGSIYALLGSVNGINLRTDATPHSCKGSPCSLPEYLYLFFELALLGDPLLGTINVVRGTPRWEPGSVLHGFPAGDPERCSEGSPSTIA